MLALGGCDLSALPKEPAGTTERILTTHVLRAGAAENPPWVRIEGGEPKGIEPAMVRAFAASLGARVQWTVNGETPLAEKLEKQELDILVSGATARSPWAKKLATSQPYANGEGGKRVLFAATGENQILLRLDRFLAADKPVIETLVAAETGK